MLILEIAAGVCLGLLSCIALWLLAALIAQWYNEKRWWWAYRKHQRMVEKLSRRYSRHLLEEAGVKLPGAVDTLKRYMPIDGGEEEFDPVATARIKEFGRRVDALR